MRRVHSTARDGGSQVSTPKCNACQCDIIMAAGDPLTVCGECLVHAIMRRAMVTPRTLEDGTREYGETQRDTTIPSGLIVSSVRVKTGPSHDAVTVWNRGAAAGVLAVDIGEGDEIARRLITTTLTEHTEADNSLGEMREIITILATQDIDRELLASLERAALILARREGWAK